MNDETVFREALSRSPEDRTTFLEQACAGRPELRAAVDALLSAHENPGDVPDTPSADLGQAVDSVGQDRDPVTGEYTPVPDNASSPFAGTIDYRPESDPSAIIAGRYTLLEKIGEGGMGEVWVAKQTEPVKRKVALKLIKAGMDTKAVLQRFEQERQALALMDHPNIARVMDGGMTAERRPFFVMELVNGLPLTQFCDQARLGVRERLELFIPICQAVQHAHQKGIIHRDLKPSNLLVTLLDGKPVPKVIDFGVAKATSGRLTDESLSTQFGTVLGTLEYMSPEQAGVSGEDIDTRADIYSLGVILYELLTGLRPLDAKELKKAAFTEMMRLIKEEEPSKPSTRLSTNESAPSLSALRQAEPKKLTALLRGELDWVVMKCLEKQRERRYETANGLARDIQHYLADEVVEARPPSTGYRLRKFVRRNKGRVAAAGLVLLALLAGMAGTTWGLIRAAKANADLAAANSELTRSRAAVQERYDLAVDAIKTFHTGVSEDFLLKQDKFKDLRDRLLSAASAFYEKLGSLLRDAADLPSRRALLEANFEVAELTGNVGRKEDALVAHRAVLTGRETLASEPGADNGARVDVGRSLTAIATLLESTGKTDEALAKYREAENVLTAAMRLSPVAPVRAALADCRSRLGYLQYLTGRAADGLVVLRLARSDQEVLAGDLGATVESRRDLASTINRIGIVLHNTGQMAEAEIEYRKSMAIFQKLADENPAVAQFRLRLGYVHGNLGGLKQLMGDLSGAEAEHRAALAIKQKLAHGNPAVTPFQSSLAMDHRNLGELLKERGKSAESEAEYRTAMDINTKLADENPAVTQFRSELANCQSSLAALLHNMGRATEAEVHFRKALEIRQKLAKDDRASTQSQRELARSYHDLGYLLSETGRAAESQVQYRKAIAINEKLADENPTVTEIRDGLANSHLDLGILLSQTGQPVESQVELRTAIVLWQKLSADNPGTADYRYGLAGALYSLGDVIRSLGRPSEACDDYEKAIALQERLVKERPDAAFRSVLAHSLRRRGLARRDLGDAAGAAADARQALSLYYGLQARSGEENFETACCEATLAGLAEPTRAGVAAAKGEGSFAKAMELLRLATSTGYSNANAFRTETALDPLRNREDFKKLVAELEKKTRTEPEKKP